MFAEALLELLKSRKSKNEIEDGSVVIVNKKVAVEEKSKALSIPTTKRTSRASLRNASKKDQKGEKQVKLKILAKLGPILSSAELALQSFNLSLAS